ncbi:hypothetical protein XYCOK13_24660 [Xylanibacillus composti]|uniref:Uncharacterized protein n=1 Tax=Xylanibacillus composti TaxID=1572762 RepID=A0A8J4H511_9BACL|nr:hypothetical protein [Xylanibacillus composti]GIQ69642.1 hypothetical protein XYCOK13_24660 [Xylanibacillus composti]
MRQWNMRSKWVRGAAACLVIVLIAAACSNRPASVPQSDSEDGDPDQIQVEVLHLNHWPVKKILDDIEAVVAEYEDDVDIHYYAFGSKEGEALAEARSITGHTPLVIFINGQKDYQLDGKDVTFYSFPEGSGTLMMGSGGWAMDDLHAVLSLLSGE